MKNNDKIPVRVKNYVHRHHHSHRDHDHHDDPWGVVYWCYNLFKPMPMCLITSYWFRPKSVEEYKIPNKKGKARPTFTFLLGILQSLTFWAGPVKKYPLLSMWFTITTYAPNPDEQFRVSAFNSEPLSQIKQTSIIWQISCFCTKLTGIWQSSSLLLCRHQTRLTLQSFAEFSH